MNREFSTGINFGAGQRLPGPLGMEPRTCSPPEPIAANSPDGGRLFRNATTSKRLKRTITRRSNRYKEKHKHELTDSLADHDDPFFITVQNQDQCATLLKKKRMGFEFVSMNDGASIEVLINDHQHAGFIGRRFLTPYLLQGETHIKVANVTPNFLKRRIGPFDLEAKSPGLIQLLALDMRGRCRGELVITIKPVESHRVQFVRVHNGPAAKKRNHSTVTENKVETMLREASRIFRSQTGIEFQKAGPIVDLEIPEDLSKGLPESLWNSKFKTGAAQTSPIAPLTVYLFEKFQLPFAGSAQNVVGVSTGGQFASRQAGWIGWTDKADAHKWGAILLAHEFAHAFIPVARWSDLDFDATGHSTHWEGLMTPDPQKGALSWREANVINPKGLGPNGLTGLIANKSLWSNSGS